jgi:hypothetical protein
MCVVDTFHAKGFCHFKRDTHRLAVHTPRGFLVLFNETRRVVSEVGELAANSTLL